MTQTSAPAAERNGVPLQRTTDGPIVAAIGGVDPQSVLQTARMISPATTEVVAVTALAPLPVTEMGEATWLVPINYEEERYAEARAELARRVEAFGSGATTWKKDVIYGEPAHAITNMAKELHATLLIMGLGRHRPFDRILGAETALRAIRHASCPVLVVHPDVKATFDQIVVATDFSPASAFAAESLVPLLRDGATVHALHVWQPSGVADTRLAALDDAYAKSLPERFLRFLRSVRFPDGVTVKTLIREGKPAERILDYARMHHADLIVAGRHGRNVLERLFIGSQTTALVRGAEQSLLVAPEPSFAERDRLQLLLKGATVSSDAKEWAVALHGFAQRNSRRIAVLEIADLVRGTQVTDSGYILLGAAYDPKAKRIEVLLGDSARGAHRVMHAIGAVDSVAIASDANGRDVGMRIHHAGGTTALTFLGE